MSLLGTPVYANPSTPLWVGSSGSQSIGNLGSLTIGSPASSAGVNGYLTAGRIAASKAINPTFGNFALSDASGNTIGGMNQVGTPGASDVYLNGTSGRSILFGTVGSSNANSSLTLSAPGANLDLLTVGGTVDALALKLQNTGTAPVVGTATLSAGTFTVSTTACDVTSYIFLTRGAVNASTAIANLRVSNKSANQFTVVSARDASPTTTETGDASSFDWMIINPA